MIRTALMIGFIGVTAAAAQDTYEVGQFDLTGDVPAGFNAGVASQHSDSITYDSLDGHAQLVVFGSLDLLGGIGPTREIARQGLIFDQSSITNKFADENFFIYSGVRNNGQIYFRYTRLGETCEGVRVMGSFVLSYDPAAAETYQPMTQPIIYALHIGACG